MAGLSVFEADRQAVKFVKAYASRLEYVFFFLFAVYAPGSLHTYYYSQIYHRNTNTCTSEHIHLYTYSRHIRSTYQRVALLQNIPPRCTAAK